jgi:hypothetical protein
MGGVEIITLLDVIPQLPIILFCDDTSNIIYFIVNLATKMVLDIVIDYSHIVAESDESTMENIRKPEAVTASEALDNLFPFALPIKLLDEIEDTILIYHIFSHFPQVLNCFKHSFSGS